MLNRIACGGFLGSWITAGSSIDGIFDDWRTAAIFAVSVTVMIACAWVIGNGHK